MSSDPPGLRDPRAAGPAATRGLGWRAVSRLTAPPTSTFLPPHSEPRSGSPLQFPFAGVSGRHVHKLLGLHGWTQRKDKTPGVQSAPSLKEVTEAQSSSLPPTQD